MNNHHRKIIVILLIAALFTFSCQTITSLVDGEDREREEEQDVEDEEEDDPYSEPVQDVTEEIIIEADEPEVEVEVEVEAEEPEPVVEEPVEEPLETVSIEVWIADNEYIFPHVQELFDVIMINYPQYELELIALSSQELLEMYQISAMAGEAPNLVIGANSWNSTFLDQDIISTDIPDINGIIPIAEKMCSTDGTAFGVPFNLAGIMMFRNPEIIPVRPASFDDLVIAAQDVSGNGIMGAMLETGMYFSLGHFFGLGGTLMDADGYPAFNDSFGMAWLEMIQQFIELGAGSAYTEDDINGFLAGDIGIIIDGSFNLSRIEEGPSSTVIDTWPAEMNGFVSGECLYFSPYNSTSEEMAARHLAEILLNADSQGFLMKNSEIFISVLENVTFPDELRAQAQAALAGGVLFPDSLAMSPYWGPVTDAIDEVYEGVNLEEILQKMYENVYSGVDDIQ